MIRHMLRAQTAFSAFSACRTRTAFSAFRKQTAFRVQNANRVPRSNMQLRSEIGCVHRTRVLGTAKDTRDSAKQVHHDNVDNQAVRFQWNKDSPVLHHWGSRAAHWPSDLRQPRHPKRIQPYLKPYAIPIQAHPHGRCQTINLAQQKSGSLSLSTSPCKLRVICV